MSVANRLTTAPAGQRVGGPAPLGATVSVRTAITCAGCRANLRVSGATPRRGRAAIVTVAASRAGAGQKQRTRKATSAIRKCPCGSGMGYGDCCGPIVEGAWARTAPELALARFTALVTGKPKMLADTTHPESISAIGNQQALLKKMERMMRRRVSNEVQPVLVDCVHGQSPDTDEDWWVLLAYSYGPEEVYTMAERYRKHKGQWLLLDEPRELPAIEQFNEFLQRFHDNRGAGDMTPLTGLYDFAWLAVPPRPPPSSSAPDPSAAGSPAFDDAYGEPEQQPQARQQWQQPHAPQQPRPQDHHPPHHLQLPEQWLSDDWPEPRNGWVYLDTAVDPETGLTAAQAAQATREMMDEVEARRGGRLDWDTYYFRHGRFMD